MPHGRYKTPLICDENNLGEVNRILQGVDIFQGSFEHVGKDLQNERVFYYLDPPYRPMFEEGKIFTMYDRTGFNDTHQKCLKQMCDYINDRGWHFMLSNSDSITKDGESYFENLYNAYYISRIEVTRFINPGDVSIRRPKEVLITNYKTV